MNSAPLKIFLKYLLFLACSLLLLSASRMLFLIFNLNIFPELNFHTFLLVFFGGLKFDFSTICMLNIFAFPFFFIPKHLLDKSFFKYVLFTIFICIGFLILAPNIIDIIYYRFTHQRLTFEIFNYIHSIRNEIGGLSLSFLMDFWYMFLIFIVLLAIYILILNKLLLSKNNKKLNVKYIHQFLFTLLIGILLFIGGRGSLGLRPLGIMHASKVAGGQYSALVLNSTYTIIKTINKENLEKKSWYSDVDAEKIYNPKKCYYNEFDSTSQKNIVLIICESLSAEHIGYLNNGLKSYTPFIDSLCGHSLVFRNMFANGKRSIDGIPSIISSLPPLMDNPFITSVYSSNKIEGIANFFNNETAFFHGGINGTMNFDAFAALSGFKYYFGKSEYTGNKNDFDGKWGIFDEPFLNFTAEKCNTFKQPFFACVFTLSAHHPYTIPEKYKDKFDKGNKPIHETIGYADFALKKFFETTATMPWYNNTIFIITADHTSEQYSDCFNTFPSNMSIPMIWFSPSDDNFKGISNVLCQQTDILPSIADYLNIKDSLIAFGNSVFDSTVTRFVITMNNNEYVMLTPNSFITTFNENYAVSETKYVDCRNIKQDSLFINIPQNNEMLIKSIIQQYNNRMILNKLSN